MNLPVGLILAGGEGSRLGRPKGDVRVTQEPMINLVVDALRSGGCEQIVVATRDGEPPHRDSFPLKVDDIVADANGWTGPQAGIVSGLNLAADLGYEWVQLAPCDVPFLDSMLLEMLGSLCSDDVDVIIPVSASGDENLLALVRTDALLAELKQARVDGERSVQALYRNLRCMRLEDRGFNEACFHNVNTQQDLELAEKLTTEREP